MAGRWWYNHPTSISTTCFDAARHPPDNPGTTHCPLPPCTPVVLLCELLQLLFELLLELQCCGLVLLQVVQLPQEVVDALLGLWSQKKHQGGGRGVEVDENVGRSARCVQENGGLLW